VWILSDQALRAFGPRSRGLAGCSLSAVAPALPGAGAAAPRRPCAAWPGRPPGGWLAARRRAGHAVPWQALAR